MQIIAHGDADAVFGGNRSAIAGNERVDERPKLTFAIPRGQAGREVQVAITERT